MYCSHCGAPAGAGGPVCKNCGRPLGGAAPPGQAGQSAMPPTPLKAGRKRPARAKIYKILSLVSGIVAGLLLLSSGGVFLLSLRHKTPPEAPVAATSGAAAPAVTPSPAPPVSGAASADAGGGEADPAPAPQSQAAAPGPLVPDPAAFAWVGTTPETETWIVPPYLDSAIEVSGEWEVCYFEMDAGQTTGLYMTANIALYDAAAHTGVAEGSNMVVTFRPQYQQAAGAETTEPRGHEPPIVCGAYFNEGFLTVSFPDGPAPVLAFWPDGEHQRGLVYEYDGQALAYGIAFTRRAPL